MEGEEAASMWTPQADVFSCVTKSTHTSHTHRNLLRRGMAHKPGGKAFGNEKENLSAHDRDTCDGINAFLHGGGGKRTCLSGGQGGF